MRIVNLIGKKGGGSELSKEEIGYIVTNYTNGKVPDYQVSALLTVVFYQDMINEEITNSTLAVADSGDIVDLSSPEGIGINKYLTGGAGNTTILVLTPLIAGVGVTMTKMFGRGPGYTGGTLGKLEAIPGSQIKLSDETFVRIVNEDKVAITGQSENLASTDRKLYALRDVTTTVDSFPLITSSIINKEAATGTGAIALDMTTGDDTFMKNIENTKRLAETMTNIGKLTNRETVAVISDILKPLGEAIGNSLEVVEAIETLQGNDPEDLVEMCCALGSQMVVLVGKTKTIDEAGALLQEALELGKALAELKETVQNQGGDPTIIEKPEWTLVARCTMELPAKQSGIVSEIVTSKLRIAAAMLDAGRKTKEDGIDHAVGLKLYKEIGDTVTKSESLLTIYSSDEEISPVIELLYKNIEASESAMKPTLIHDIITE